MFLRNVGNLLRSETVGVSGQAAMAATKRPQRIVRGKQGNDGLKLSYDRKVSPRGWYQESRNRWVPRVPNSFGLPRVITCPGMTDPCKDVCYAIGSENGSGVAELLHHNLRLLQEAGTIGGMEQLIVRMLAGYEAEAEHYHLKPQERIFRVHWDGDFFSVPYALVWARAIRAYPGVQFFAYTRSIAPPVNVVPFLAGIPNLALYISADEDNLLAAVRMVEAYPDVNLARFAKDFRRARQLTPERPSVVCPENSGSMPLMDQGEGACVRCQLCPQSRKDVLFAVSGLEDADYGQGVLMLAMPKIRSSAKPLITPEAVAAASKAGLCANPNCGNPLPAQKHRGRRRKWCKPNCRWEVYHALRALRDEPQDHDEVMVV